jgi:2-polyprenyl-6-methoxyphenol hydroxylase-like FAD-dependent oxidoreductase
MPDKWRVLIVGGGIPGLALAPRLARTGVTVEVVERAPCGGLRVPAPTCRAVPAQRLSQLFAQFADPAATLLDALDTAADIHVSTIQEVARTSGANPGRASERGTTRRRRGDSPRRVGGPADPADRAPAGLTEREAYSPAACPWSTG